MNQYHQLLQTLKPKKAELAAATEHLQRLQQ